MRSINSAQLKGKLTSFKSELKLSNAAIFTVQESHYELRVKFRKKILKFLNQLEKS